MLVSLGLSVLAWTQGVRFFCGDDNAPRKDVQLKERLEALTLEVVASITRRQPIVEALSVAGT